MQILHHLVWADPDDTEAKELQADAYEQLGYQQEVPQYRAIFLTAAKELREGVGTGRGSAPPTRTRSWRCRSACCSTSSPST